MCPIDWKKNGEDEEVKESPIHESNLSEDRMISDDSSFMATNHSQFFTGSHIFICSFRMQLRREIAKLLTAIFSRELKRTPKWKEEEEALREELTTIKIYRGQPLASYY